MISFVIWFAAAAVLALYTRGWRRAVLLTLYLAGTVLVLLN